jgi:P27 family predicted phage terminase small subunit
MNPRKTDTMRELTGNPGHRSSKRALGLERSVQAPAAPDYFNPDARLEWERVAPDLWRARHLATVDISILENFCLLAAVVRRAHRELAAAGLSVKSKRSAPRQHPALKTILSSLPILRSYADALGIGAKARGQVNPLADPQKDLFSDLDLDDEDEEPESAGSGPPTDEGKLN